MSTYQILLTLTGLLFILCLIFIPRIIKAFLKEPKPTKRIPQAWFPPVHRKVQNPNDRFRGSLQPQQLKSIPGDFEKLEQRLKDTGENPENLADMFSLYFADIEHFLNTIGITKYHQLYRDFWHFKDKLYMLKHYQDQDRQGFKVTRKQTWNYGYYLILRLYLNQKLMEYVPSINYHKVYQESIGTEKFRNQVFEMHAACTNIGYNNYEEFIEELSKELNPRIGDLKPEDLEKLKQEIDPFGLG